MAFEVSYIIEAIDKFTAVSTKISESMNVMDKRISNAGSTLNGFQTKMNTHAESWAKLGEHTKYYSLAAAGALSFAFHEWSKQETAIDRVAFTIQNAGKRVGVTMEEIESMSEKMSVGSIFSKTDVLESSERLLLVKGMTKKTFGEASALAADYAAKTGRSLPEAAQTIGRALTSPQRGLRTLIDLGVKLNSAQQAQITAWMNTGQTAKAQAFIYDALTQKVGGTAAMMAKTSSGQIKQMDVAMEEMGVTVGGAVAPAFLSLIHLITRLANGFSHLSPWLQKAIVGAVALAAIAAPLAFLFSGLATIAGVLATAISALGVVMATLGAALFVAYAPIILIVAALAAMGAAIYEVHKHWEKIVEVIKHAYQWMQKIGQEFSSGGAVTVMKTISHIFSSSAQVGGQIDVNIKDKGGNVGSTSARSDSGVDLNVGTNMVGAG